MRTSRPAEPAGLVRAGAVRVGASLRAGGFALLVLLVAAGTVDAQSPRSEPDPAPILSQASERHLALDAFCADFEQSLEVPLLRQTTESRGTLCQKGGELFSMRFSEPEGDRVIADGEYLWTYYPSMDRGQVVRSTLASGSGGFDLHREFLSEPGRKYEPTYEERDEVNGAPAHRIALAPRDASVYEGARVWVDVETHLLRKVEIEEENGSIRTVVLRNLRLNPDLDPGLFRFEPPPEAQVIRR